MAILTAAQQQWDTTVTIEVQQLGGMQLVGISLLPAASNFGMTRHCIGRGRRDN